MHGSVGAFDWLQRQWVFIGATIGANAVVLSNLQFLPRAVLEKALLATYCFWVVLRDANDASVQIINFEGGLRFCQTALWQYA